MRRIVWLSLALWACPSSPTAEDLSLAIIRVSPGAIPSGLPVELWVDAHGLTSNVELEIDGRVVPTERIGSRLRVWLEAAPRGARSLVLLRGGERSPPYGLVVNDPPQIGDPGPQLLRTGQLLEIPLDVSDPDGDPLQISVKGPARFDGTTLRVGSDQEGDLTLTVYASDGISRAEHAIRVRIREQLPAAKIGAVDFERGRRFVLTGSDFARGDEVWVEKQRVPAVVTHAERIDAVAPDLWRGQHVVRLMRSGVVLSALRFAVGNTPPYIADLGTVSVRENELSLTPIEVSDHDQDSLRVLAIERPPGSVWREQERVLEFRPDFIQGGHLYPVTILAADGESRTLKRFKIRVRQRELPLPPKILRREERRETVRYEVEQPRQRGAERAFRARLSVPKRASRATPLPVRVSLHGFGMPLPHFGRADEFVLYPHDPEDTYWWGRVGADGKVQNLTQQRVLGLLEWVLRTFEGADRNRVSLRGVSMGATGAATIGLLYARHFALVEAELGQVVPRLHRPSRIRQLASLWGGPNDGWPATYERGFGRSVWDETDLTRVLRDEPEARDQLLFLRWAKDDPIIHFNNLTEPSPLTFSSLQESLQAHHVAHYVVWDEGAHGPVDPMLGPRWWDAGWDRIRDPVTFVRLDRPVIAFSRADRDDDPGRDGDGSRPPSADRGFAGEHEIPLDTGWAGAVAGAINRHLRWDARDIVDAPDRLEVTLFLATGPLRPPPFYAYPPRGEIAGQGTVHADVTFRRVRAFTCLAGEWLRFSFGGSEGTVRAGPDGEVTVPVLSIGEPTRLIVERLHPLGGRPNSSPAKALRAGPG